MKRTTALLLAIGALAATAGAAESPPCFDFGAWRAAVVADDAAAAEQATAAAQAACGCASAADACLPPPGYSQMIAPARLRETARRVFAWRRETLAKCGPLPEAAPAEAKAKLQCYRTQAEAFAEGLAGEPFGGAFAPLPTAAVAGETARLSSLTGPGDPAPKSHDAKSYSEEAQGVGRQICTLTTKLEAASDRLDHVKRRGSEGAEYKWLREQELNAEIKELSEALLSLKRKFQLLTGEKYDPYVFCGPADDIRK